MSMVNQMFGVAASVAWMRCGGSGTTTRYVLASLAKGFGGNTGDGAYIHDLFAARTGSFNNCGFGSTSLYKSTLENNTLPLSSFSQIGAAAIIYAYANLPNISSTGVLSFINTFTTTLNSFDNTEPDTAFTQADLNFTLSSFNLSLINSGISQCASGNIEKAINYNWYDAEPLFINPDFDSMTQLIKDTECQYYYLSGELVYPGVPTFNTPCVSFTSTINTPTGQVTINVFKSTPCIDDNTYVGPKSGIKFYREFSDGPGTSGYFDYATMKQYVNFDQAVLAPEDYEFNVDNVFANARNPDGTYIFLKSGVIMDLPGYYYSGREFGPGRTNWIDEGCTNHPPFPLMRMHQGDNKPKWYEQAVSSGPPNFTCNYSSGLNNWTGWKFAVFKLDDIYVHDYSDINVNPKLDTGRVLKRALNLDNSNVSGTPISPYYYATDTGDGLLICGDWNNFGAAKYVGPPQLNGHSSLPGFVFFQTFDNFTFPSGGEFATVCLRPAIGVNNTDFLVSNFNAFSGIDPSHSAVGSPAAHIVINQTISSANMTGMDDTFRKVFTIGDNFGNQALGTSGMQANAGFLYTGYAYFFNGVSVKPGDLLANNSQKVGDAYSTIKYVKGYISGSQEFDIALQYAYAYTGDTSTGVNTTGILTYYSYFDTNVLGAVNTGWLTDFAPTPDLIVNTYGVYQPVYAYMDVENYMPRYINGPYLSYDSQFLYPNASLADQAYISELNGFPNRVQYVVSIKEESVREAYLTSGFGGITNNKYIVRPDQFGNIAPLETLMSTPFIPNDSTYTFKYDYLRNQTLYPRQGSFFYQGNTWTGFVNQDYVPSTSGCPQGQLNTTVFQNSIGAQAFQQGVRMTGVLRDRNLYTGRSGTFGASAFSEPFGGGLYWVYKGTVITGEMRYAPPVFDLSTYSIDPTDDLTVDMSNTLYYPTAPAGSNNGFIWNASLYDNMSQYNGRDPIFYQYVGGRSGAGANVDGGYNTHGIIGDAWYNFLAANWGYSPQECFSEIFYYRDPTQDSYLSLMAMTPTGLNLYMRGMNYYPYYLSWQYQPFLTSESLDNIGVNIKAAREVTKANFYFDFDLKDTFNPLKSGIVSTGLDSGLYSSSGLTIGPFDRDVELCVTGGNSFATSGYMIVDGQIITQPQGAGGCSDFLTQFVIDSGIFLNQDGRNKLVTTFRLVPSGYTTNINFSGNSLLGVSGKAVVTIRPRTCAGAVNVFNTDSSAFSGDQSMLDSFRFVDNGSEALFTIPNDGQFENLVGQTFSFTTTARKEVMYPVPDPTDFDTILRPTFDALGNKIYKQAHPTQAYWQIKTPNAYFTGIRETTRVHVSVDSITTISGRGQIPYQTFKTIIPSGECIISGIFAYTGEAEAAIVSDGIILSGISGAKALTGRFEPIYVSDTMLRVPTGMFLIPSGSSPHPILPAPNYMKQRSNVFQVTGNDLYIPVSPTTGSDYNAFLWPAWSDLALLNPELVYEQLPPDDGNVFQRSYLTFSASQGQKVYSGHNLSENVTYGVVAQYTFIDSTATNPIYNTGTCIFSGETIKTGLNSGDLSGILTSEGNSLTMAINLNNYKK